MNNFGFSLYLNLYTFESILLCYILLSLLVGTYFSTRWWLNYPTLINFFLKNSLIFLIVSFLSFYQIFDIQIINDFSFYGLFQNNKFILIWISFILFYFIIFKSLALNYFKRENFFIDNFYQFEFSILFLLLLLSMIILIKSNDLLSIYLSVEFQSLILYIFAASKRYSLLATEAGLKYFIQGAFSSGLLLLGFSFLYGFTGLSNISDFYIFFGDYSKVYLIFDENDFFVFGGLVVSIFLILAAFYFKLSIFPFSLWVPDVYEGSSTIITLLFSTLPKLSIFVIFLKIHLAVIIGFSIFYHTDFWFYFEWIIACLSILFGVLGAIQQSKLKRIIAYSTINHFGLILLSLILWTPLSLFAAFFYLFSYSILNFSLFSVLLVLREANTGIKLKNIEDLVQLKKANPLLAFILVIMLFSVAGIPPLFGFFSKFYILSAVWIESYNNISNEPIYLLGISAIVLSSVISIFYYIRIIRKLYFTNISIENYTQFYNLTYLDSIMISFFFIFNVFSMFYIKSLFWIIWNFVIFLQHLVNF